MSMFCMCVNYIISYNIYIHAVLMYYCVNLSFAYSCNKSEKYNMIYDNNNVLRI